MGKLAPIGDSVDSKTGKLTKVDGSDQFSMVWQHPNFGSQHCCLYSVRVLQEPAARHFTLGVLVLQMDPEEQTRYPVTILA